MNSLIEFDVLNQIESSDNWVLQRAYSHQFHQQVLIKKIPSSDQQHIVKLYYDFDQMKLFSFDRILKPIHIDQFSDGYCILFENFDGISLQEMMTQRPSIRDFLTMTIELANIFIELHQQQILYRNMSAKHFLVNPTTFQIKLFNLEHTSNFHYELASALENPYDHGDQLVYCSPEETGRLNKTVDHRADLYALGVLFYEMLAGQFPFSSPDLADLIYKIVSEPTPSLMQYRSNLPEMLMLIIEKLLNKNPENRYQSATGLKEDLIRCSNQLSTEGCISPFPLATSDIQHSLSLSSNLFGRDKELALLQQQFKQIQYKEKSFIFIRGKVGSGKSSLIQQFRNYNNQSNSIFLTVVFDELQQDTQFAPIITALRNQLKLFYMSGESTVTYWTSIFEQEKIQLSSELITLMPELAWFFTNQFENIINNPKELNLLLDRALLKIISAFTKQQPVILFLDNMHWADHNSIPFLQFLYDQHEAGSFLVIASYNEDVLTADHALHTLKKNITVYTDIELFPLSNEHLQQWIITSLNEDTPTSRSFAQLLYYVTKGNPLFVKELFLSFQQEKLVYYDSQQKSWQFNLDQVSQSTFSDNLLNLIVQRIYTLPPNERELLKLASCFGNAFEFSKLQQVSETQSTSLIALLNTLIHEGFIIPLTTHYKWASTYERFGILDQYSFHYRFVHERIQQVAYMSLPENERQQIHLTIGKMLSAIEPLEQSDTFLFEKINHLNHCQNLLSEAEKLALSRLNYQVGHKTISSGLFMNGLVFVEMSAQLLPEDCWESQHEFSMEVIKLLADCKYLTGQAVEAEHYFNTVLTHSRTRIEKLAIYNKLVLFYSDQELVEKAIETVYKALALCNIHFGEHITTSALIKEYTLLQTALFKHKTQDLLHLKMNEDPEINLILQLLVNASGCALLLDGTLYTMLNLRAMRLILKHGDVDIAAIVYSSYAGILNTVFKSFGTSYQFGLLSINHIEKSNNTLLKSNVYMTFGTLINQWKMPFEKNIYYLKKAQSYCFEGTVYKLFYAICGSIICEILLTQSIPLSGIAKELEQQKSGIIHAENKIPTEYIIEFEFWLSILLHPQKKLNWKMPITHQDEASFYQMHLILRLQMSFLLHESEQAQIIMKSLINPMKSSILLPYSPQYYFYTALWIMRLPKQHSTQAQTKRNEKQTLKDCLRQLQKFARHSPENFEHLYILVKAEYNHFYNIQGEELFYYDRAIQLAQMNGYLRDEAIACECAARYYVKNKRPKQARDYMFRGIQLMKDWEAPRVVTKWEQVYENLIERRAISKKQLTTPVDMRTVFETNQVIARETKMDILLRKVLFSLMKHADADCSYFIKKEQQHMNVLAKAQMLDSSFTFANSSTTIELDDFIHSIVRYVVQSEEHVIIDDAQQHSVFSNTSSTVKSVLCLPIHYQGQMTAILYLENNMTSHVFTPDKLELLKMISSQIAVSIDHAQLYEGLESQVQERTEKLNELNRDLSAANVQLQLHQTERKLLLQNISHDLRSPITSILGYVELILDGIVTEPTKQQAYLVRSKERLISLNGLIQDLFDLSQLEAGRMEFKLERWSVPDLFHKFNSKFKFDVEQANLTYTTNLHRLGEDYVAVDIRRIEQVLSNLLDNAIKYTKHGMIHFSMLVQDNKLICMVEDSGIGIPVNELPFVFDSHYGASNNQSHHQSHGIGLAICKQIIAHHKGEIFVDSTEMVGSHFSFILPLIE